VSTPGRKQPRKPRNTASVEYDQTTSETKIFEQENIGEAPHTNVTKDFTSAATPSTVTEGYSAPVVLPSPEDITVYMVPLSDVQKYQDSISDASWASFFLALFIGGIMGILVNWVTSLSINKLSLIFLAILSLGTVGFGIWWSIAYARAKSAKRTLNRYQKPPSDKR